MGVAGCLGALILLLVGVASVGWVVWVAVTVPWQAADFFGSSLANRVRVVALPFGLLALVPVAAGVLALGHPSGRTQVIGAFIALGYGILLAEIWELDQELQFDIIGGALLLAAVLLLFAAVTGHRADGARRRPDG